MKVLVVGGGGREHALVWKIAQSPRVDSLVCLPGNPGIARLARLSPGSADDVDGIVATARAERPDLVVVGPDNPIAAGAVDRLTAAGFATFGPTKTAAEIESSKAWAKEFMARRNIPTASFAVFDDAGAAHRHVDRAGPPLVVKASGLALGKGVIICPEREDAHRAVASIMEEGAFGVAGREVVIESCLRGEEVSFLAFVDGERFAPLAPSRDHKRVFDGNLGPNTGGMGAYAPVGELTSEVREEVVRRIVGPTVTGLAREGRPFAGMLYAGLMLTSEGPKVLEFNARFGDPEAQVVLPLLRGDVVDIMTSCVSGNLRPEKVISSARAAVCVVLASPGYPGAYRKGLPIHGLDAAEAMDDVLVFHAGTAGDGPAVTAGGRVLGVTGLGDSLHAATGRAYAGAARIRFEGAHYRRDIAAGAPANREGGRTS